MHANRLLNEVIVMTNSYLLQLAVGEGFRSSLIAPEDVPINPEFRKYCEENLCGKYGANYSCPPDCGTVEELKQRILSEDNCLILQTIWDIDGYEDKSTIDNAKLKHNQMVLSLKSQLEQLGLICFCSGYNGCPLCNPCKRILNEPCAHPDKRISCMSAYCIDVAELAQKCKLDFAWSSDKLHLFGMIAFHEA